MTLIATPARASTARGPASLAARLAAGDARAVVTFAGQGVDVLDELAALVAQRPGAAAGRRARARPCSRAWPASDLARSSGAYRHGVDVGAWVMDPDGAPPVDYLRGAAVAYPLSLLAQALLWRALWADALADAVGAGSIVGLAGHSQGLLAALLVAEDPAVGRTRCWSATCERAAVQGLHMAAAATGRSPMAAIDGVTLARLRAAAGRATRHASRSSTRRRGSSSPARRRRSTRSTPASPRSPRARRPSAARVAAAARRCASTWTPLGVDVPFHSPALAEPLARFGAWLGERAAPVLGARARRRRRSRSRSQFVEPVRWDAVARVDHASSTPTGCSISARARPSRG